MGKSGQQWVKYKDSALKSFSEKRYEVAESSLIAALEECQDFKETDARNLLTIEKLAEVYWCLANFEQARIFSEQLVKLHESNASLSKGNHLAFLIDLAMILHVSKDYPRAEKTYKSAVSLSDEVLGRNHMYSTKIRSLLADLLVSKGDNRAAALLKVPPKVVTIRDWIGSNSIKLPSTTKDELKKSQVATGNNKQVMLISVSQPDAEAIFQSNQESAKIAEKEGRLAFADTLCQLNLKILEKFGVEGPILANALESICNIKQKKGLVTEAIEFYQRAHKVKEKALGNVHPVVAHSFGQLANYYYQLSDYKNAEPLAKKCAEMYEKIHGLDHPEVACAIHNLATLYHVQRKYEHAESAYKRSLDIKNKVFGPEHPETKRLMNSYAELLAQTSEPPDTGNGGKGDEIPGMITGSWKVMQMNSAESLTAPGGEPCDICGADLGGETVCGHCGFDTSAGI